MELAPTTYCNACGRPSHLYGNRDVRTGWEGWCSVCNGHWHLQKAKVLKAEIECHLKEVSSTHVFVSSGIASVIACYIACPEYERDLVRRAHVTAAQIYWTTDPDANTDDEDSSGVCHFNLEFTNGYFEQMMSHAVDACRTAAGSAAEPGTDGPDGCVAGGNNRAFGESLGCYFKVHGATLSAAITSCFQRVISTVPFSTEDDGIDILSCSGTSRAESPHLRADLTM